MFRRVCDLSSWVLGHAVKTTFRSDCHGKLPTAERWSSHTEDLVSDIVLANEVAKKLLIHARLVNDLCHCQLDVPTCRLLELTAVSQNVHPSSIAFNNTGSASARLRSEPKPKLIPMAPKPGTGTVVLPKGIVKTILFAS